MPDGWRKKIHSKPKDLKAASATSSRPGTPVTGRVSTPNQTGDAEDTKSELSEPLTTPRRQAFARLVSGHVFFKDNYEKPGFAEPWNEDVPPTQVQLIDPYMALQSVFSFMNTLPSRPIPVSYYNGLFQIFEDYRKVKDEKDHIKEMIQKVTIRVQEVEHELGDTKNRYQEEIRRLELLMADDNASGMAKVIRARQGSLVERKKFHNKVASHSQRNTSCDDMAMSDVEEEIRTKTQNVLLQRPLSPSGKMAALSRQFSKVDPTDDLHIGTPPTQDKTTFLSSNVHGEFDLTSLGTVHDSNSVTQSAERELSQDANVMPQNAEPLLSSGADYDAFVALRELGTLVARKKGINVAQFIKGLLHLLGMDERNEEQDNATDSVSDNGTESTFESAEDSDEFDQTLTPTKLPRHSQSQPQLSSEQRRKRHFSFEPGDDEISQFNRDVTSYDTERPAEETDRAEVSFTGSREAPQHLEGHQSDKLSKIPSPLSKPGYRSTGRKSSFSTVQLGNRRTSTSSVLTAIRQDSGGSVRSSSQNNSVAAIAAVRATRLSETMREDNSSSSQREDA